MHALRNLLLRGLVTLLPISLTLYLLWWLGSAAESGLGALIRLGLPERLYVVGMGLALGLVLVVIAGILSRVFFGRWLITLAERQIIRIPLLKTVYGSLKDLTVFVAGQRRQGSQVVTVTVGDSELRLIGLLTRDSAQQLTGDAGDRDRVAVYLPLSYALGGFLVLVPRQRVTPIGINAESALRTVLTAGLSTAEGA